VHVIFELYEMAHKISLRSINENVVVLRVFYYIYNSCIKKAILNSKKQIHMHIPPYTLMNYILYNMLLNQQIKHFSFVRSVFPFNPTIRHKLRLKVNRTKKYGHKSNFLFNFLFRVLVIKNIISRVSRYT